MSADDRQSVRRTHPGRAGCGRCRLQFAVLSFAGLALWTSSWVGSQANQGAREYVRVGCDSCHGPEAKGAGQAPEIAGLTRPFPEFVKIVREGIGEMPPHTKDAVSDVQLTAIYRWLTQLTSNSTDRVGATTAR